MPTPWVPVMRSAFGDPAFRAVAAQFAEQIEEEILTVLTKTPYSP